jgi:hypothetical protein
MLPQTQNETNRRSVRSVVRVVQYQILKMRPMRLMGNLDEGIWRAFPSGLRTRICGIAENDRRLDTCAEYDFPIVKYRSWPVDAIGINQSRFQ